MKDSKKELLPRQYDLVDCMTLYTLTQLAELLQIHPKAMGTVCIWAVFFNIQRWRMKTEWKKLEIPEELYSFDDGEDA